MSKCVLDWLEESCKKNPSKIVYQDVEHAISFSELKRKAKAIGSSLCGLETKKPVAVLSGRCIETIIAFLGVVYSGRAYAPIDGTLPSSRIHTILEVLQPEVIVVSDAFYEVVKDLPYTIYRLEELLECPVDEAYLKKCYEGIIKVDPLYVIFTSGSTGKPKGVITSHEALMTYIESYAKVMEIEEADVFGNQSPLDYIAAIRDIYLPLYKGASSVIIPKSYFMQVNALFDCLNLFGVTCVGWSVSAFTIASALGAFQDVQLETLRKICFSGSIMPMACLEQWMTALPDAKFVNQYGPTEATASCTYHVVSEEDLKLKSLPIGKAYENYLVFLLDEDLTETVDGEIGEICVSGPILALGYYNDEERTNAAFVQNPNTKGYYERMYRTGDYGRYNEHGLLEFHGRKDRQIKLMGHRVELDEIEFAANKLDGMEECVSLYHAKKEAIYLFYTGRLSKKEVSIGLRNVLPMFMVPRKIVQLESLPKLPNGKFDLNTLKESM